MQFGEDWLLWHKKHHKCNAALIVDRGPPEVINARAMEFAALLQSDEQVAKELALMVIVALNSDWPLGRTECGHEAHPINAPDAPGKNRMPKPSPDSWQGPLSYSLLYDLLRWRFLRDARSVANLQVNELVPALGSGGSMFDAAVEASAGAISLRGQRAYPWNLRKGKEPSFGDHICTPFDILPRETRWCVSPGKLQPEAIWMPTRILGVKPQKGHLGFWQFMALRYCRPLGSNVGQIVPKSSLVENDDLLKIAKHFGAKPKRQPSLPNAMPKSESTEGSSDSRVAIVTTMKNEGPFILEWIAYHRAIGVQDFLVYTNDCTDGTDDLLRLLAKKDFAIGGIIRTDVLI